MWLCFNSWCLSFDLFYFSIFVVFKLWSLPLSRYALMHGHISGCLAGCYHPAGLTLSHSTVGRCLSLLSLSDHLFPLLPPRHSTSPPRCHRRSLWETLRVVRSWEGRTTLGQCQAWWQDTWMLGKVTSVSGAIYTWAKDGRDVLHFWILGNRWLRHAPSANQVLQSVRKSLKLSFGLITGG